MRILITNDDGIHAPGLFALVEGLNAHHELSIVAPEQEQSAVGHAITLLQPLRVKPVNLRNGMRGFAVSGTPADCVKIAVAEILTEPPDLVLSGINLGANAGIDALYSGTVSAATEGAILGIPSIAVSLDTFTDPDFTASVHIVRRLVDRASAGDLPLNSALNVNVPALPWEEIKGIAYTRHGASRYEERFERRVDPRGNSYFWQTGNTHLLRVELGTDRHALQQGKIAITPIHFDLTDYRALELLSKRPIHEETM